MTLTVPNVPDEIDSALRRRAHIEGKSVEAVAVEALQAGLGLANAVGKKDLSDIAGTWIDDPEVDAALRDQDRIDPELWK